MRSLRYALRLLGQGVGYSVSERRLPLLVVLVLAPLLVLIALVLGVASPFVVYPFV